jgi:DNA-binding transcriptional LysR family regulator
MELRQLHYFVTLAEELHFGHAAAREHIVQSALSQQIQRLEREVGTRLFERDTHHVQLTPAGSAFLVDARQILAHADRAARAARRAASPTPTLRVGVVDAGYDSMPRIIRAVQRRHPDVEVHEVEAGVPQQYSLLADGRLDVGFGRVWLDPPGMASELFRLDPLGVLVPERHPLAGRLTVPVATLADEPMLLEEEDRAPEFNQFVIDLCRTVGFTPTLYRGTVESITAAVDLVANGRCVLCVPSSCRSPLPGVVWRRLVEPVSRYPWSVLWRAGDRSAHVQAVVECARLLSREQNWLDEVREATG